MSRELARQLEELAHDYQEELEAAEQRFRERLTALLGPGPASVSIVADSAVDGAGDPPPPVPYSPPARARGQGRLDCDRCGREFTRPNARAMHEKHCDGAGTQRVRPNARETYLCDRCDQGYATRELLDAHRPDHPAIPTPQYVGTRTPLVAIGGE